MAKLLIAENELALREFIARGLEQRGHKVTMGQDGADALAHLKKGKFDLLLTDIDMPIMDGIALSMTVGREYPKTKIIIMSGHEHQITMLWQAIEKLSARSRELPTADCVPQDAQTREQFDAERFSQLVK